MTTPSENTGYDAMKMLRGNIKKVFTDEDLDNIENSEGLKESRDDDRGDSIVKPNKITDSESEDDRLENKQRQAYNSSSDSDSDEGEPYVKSKKSDRRKVCADVAAKKESDVRKDKTQGKEDNNSSGDESRRQTILLSATLTQPVEKLAGLAMDHPVFIDAAKENLEAIGADASELNEDLVVPQSVNQSYIVTPPKLRIVTLSAYIAGKCKVDSPYQIIYPFILFQLSQMSFLPLTEPRST